MLRHLDEDEPETDEYEGRYFKAVVADNNDPKKRERVRVVIPGLWDKIDDCPWIPSLARCLFGRKAGFGHFGVPVLNSKVIVVLQDGDPHYPVYLGEFLDEGDQITEAGVNYPNRYGFKDPTGNVLYIDMTPGGVVFYMKHKSGTIYQVDDSGNVTWTIVGNLTLNINGTFSQTSGGNATFVAPRIDLNP